METPLAIGIVGAGNMGKVYSQVISETGLRFRAKVAAVCDTAAERAQQLAGPDAASYDNLEAMLDSEKLDLVYLATPDHLHRKPFEAIMAAGVPCLVEKPLAA
ncbi:MAG: Gfo/Idh/MocA family oxidoreductase, partial [Bifidobacteriaceae bacterium]|nr:Gfo/Idh/MocA family oxidoreductase [Bifidobacteriaceae bacterium]